MILEILDQNLHPIGAVEKITSLQWQRRHVECGEFELHAPLTMEHLELLQIDHYIVLRYDEEVGVIMYRQLYQDDSGQESIVIRGRLSKCLLQRRIIWGSEHFNTSAGMAISRLINNHCISPKDAKRKIPYLSCNISEKGKNIKMQTSYANVMEECEKICLLGDIGYRLILSDGSFVVVTCSGKNRTVNQNINDHVVFSDEYENVKNQNYVYSVMDHANVVLSAGIGEGKDRRIVSVGDSSGLNRYEIFDDQRGLTMTKEDGESEYTESEYLELLKESGISLLKEYPITEQFTFKNAERSNFVYQRDYDLGDVVTCINSKWGFVIDTQIMGVNEIYEQSGKKIDLIFGNELPTLMKKIKRLR